MRCLLPIGLLVLAGCASVADTGVAAAGAAGTGDQVQLVVAGPPLDAPQDWQRQFYTMPATVQSVEDGGLVAQAWSMLGREDRAARLGQSEYVPAECALLPGSPTGWDAVADAIAAQATRHRIMIINESHVVTRHRHMTRSLLPRLHALGFRALAAETFFNPGEPVPISNQPGIHWPRQDDGFYSREVAFGRMVRDAKAQGFRLYGYENIGDGEPPENESIAQRISRREEAQARNLAAIMATLAPDERLIVHVGYSHALEVPRPARDDEGGGPDISFMAARLKALTGIDPLTIAQTHCRHAEGEAILAEAPASVPPGGFDMVISHQIDLFVQHRPQWRRDAGDIPVAIPAALRPTAEPLVIEAFGWDEPFTAVPMDRMLVEPGEDIPLMLPPGQYRVRAVRMVAQP